MEDASTLSGGEESSLLWADSSPRQSKGLDQQVVTAFQPHVEPCLPSSRLPPGLSPKEKLRGAPDPAHRSQD